nr:MAG TPA: tail protein [Caudoviricetes sp.]
MSKVMDSKTFSEKLYNTLPVMYHNADSMVDYALKRYLQVLSDGGYSFVVDELNGILNLNDPERTPSEVLGVLFEQYGLPLFNGIPEVYLRKLLPILGDLYARKGATTVIEYLTSIISDVKTDIVISPDFLNDYHVDLRLEMDYDQTGARDLPDREQLLRIIKEFLPFFIEVTIIFVYLFYETAKLQARERLEDFVTEVRSEHSRLLSGNREGLFPTLNNFDLGLNKSIYLNESYYYNVEVDKFWDKINYILQETGNLDRRKSNQYLRPTLNNQFKLLNEDLVLNDYIDTDELVATNINTAPMLDIGRLRVLEVIMDSMKYICEEQATISSNGDLSVDSIVYSDNEIAVLKSDKSTALYKGILNNLAVRLNNNFYLNEGVDTDETIDTIGLADNTSLDSEDTHRKESLVIGEQRFYASLNTGFTFNKDLLTNEGHVDIGNLVGEDLEEHTVKNNVQETASVENEHDTEIMAFLNTSICVLNTMILNNIPEYVKITINGETQVKYPTMFGLM